jgi:hypothetical protein
MEYGMEYWLNYELTSTQLWEHYKLPNNLATHSDLIKVCKIES